MKIHKINFDFQADTDSREWNEILSDGHSPFKGKLQI